MSNQVDRHYYEVATPGSISEKLAAIARDKIYTDFLRFCRPSASDKILDVGVSDVVGDAANVLERRYSPNAISRRSAWGVETRSRLPFHRSNTVRLSPTMHCRSMTGHSTSLRRTRFLNTSAASKTSASSSLNYCALAAASLSPSRTDFSRSNTIPRSPSFIGSTPLSRWRAGYSTKRSGHRQRI